jgi:hypothetical protein
MLNVKGNNQRYLQVQAWVKVYPLIWLDDFEYCSVHIPRQIKA